MAPLIVILLVAAVLRLLPDLGARAPWDADQGQDMLVLRALAQDGVIPLLGPPASTGGIHHGAAYYLAVAPPALLTGGADPVAVTAWIALLGIAAVAGMYWLAGSVGGRVAAVVAAVAMAVSGASVAESTIIWNPSLVAPAAILAVGAAWRAATTGETRWWVLAAVGSALTAQAHLLGALLIPPIVALFLAHARLPIAGTGPSPDEPRQAVDRPDVSGPRPMARVAVLALIAGAATFLPLMVNELVTGGAELRALVDGIASGSGGGAVPSPDGTVPGNDPGLLIRLGVIAIRVLGWPLAGLITSAPAAVVAAASAVVAILAWRLLAARGLERVVVRWIAGSLVWIIVALAFVAPSLATVTPGLPNDHYHAIADPLVFLTVGLGAAAAWRSRAGPGRRVARGAAVGGLGVLLIWNLATQPPAVAPDGSYADARRSAERILAGAEGAPIELRSLPVAKSPAALAYPLTLAGARLLSGGEPGPEPRVIVVLCDPRLEALIGAPCGGPAEDATLTDIAPDARPELADRFLATPRQHVSLYRTP